MELMQIVQQTGLLPEQIADLPLLRQRKDNDPQNPYLLFLLDRAERVLQSEHRFDQLLEQVHQGSMIDNAAQTDSCQYQLTDRQYVRIARND